MPKTKYTIDFLEPIIKDSVSFREVISKLGLQDSGGNNTHIRKVVKKLQIDTSHFLGQGWSKNKTFPPKYPIEDYLSNKRPIHSNRLKNRLLKEGFFERRCNMCKNTEWLDNPISLELHHIDCNHSNNNLSNLEILCPNCHALTHTLARDCHSKSKTKPKIEEDKKYRNICISCSKPTNNQKYCSYDCSRINSRKVIRPSYEELMSELEHSNYSAVGRKYGVSDNAIRKWVKSYEKDKVSPN